MVTGESLAVVIDLQLDVPVAVPDERFLVSRPHLLGSALSFDAEVTSPR